MASWLETRTVLSRLAELHSAGQPCALATVIRVNGSAYRRPGAKLLIEATGATTGNVSGGCLEQDVIEVAQRVIRNGRAERRSYCSSGDEINAWDLGVGCEGEVEVLVEPVLDGWDEVRAQLALELPFIVRTPIAQTGSGRSLIVLDGNDRSADQASGLLPDEGRGEFFSDLLVPAPRLIIIGAGNDAQPLAQLALAAGLRVTVVDHRPGLLTASRFPGGTVLLNRWPNGDAFEGVCEANSLAVLMTHHFADDLAYLRELLPMNAQYIGILGPRQRTERLLSTIGVAGDPRVHGPVGLDIGGEGATQVAVAIVAQLLAVCANRSAESLRDRTDPIHSVGN